MPNRIEYSNIVPIPSNTNLPFNPSYPLLLVDGPFPFVEAPVLEPMAISFFGFSEYASPCSAVAGLLRQ